MDLQIVHQEKKLQLIYLHGFASGPQASKAKYFAERCRELDMDLVIPDLNHPDFEHMTLSSQIEMVEDLISDKSDQKLYVIIGSSLGALVATLTAQRQKRVVGLILLAPAFALKQIFERTWASQLNSWKEYGYLEIHHYAYEKQMRLGLNFWNDLQAWQTENLKIDVPALVVHGQNDETVPLADTIEFCGRNSEHADLCVLDDDHQLIKSLPKIWSMTKKFLSRFEPWQKVERDPLS